MLIYDRIKQLCKENGVTVTGTEATLGFARGSLCKIDKNKPSMDKVAKLADFLHTTTDYIMTGNSAGDLSSNSLTPKDERDIAKDMENIRQKLMNGTDGPLSYDGEPIPAEDAELLLGQIELMMHRLKPINKEKYNPNKNKK
jgi:hypothetical protein